MTSRRIQKSPQRSRGRSKMMTMRPFTTISLTLIGIAILNEITILHDVTFGTSSRYLTADEDGESSKEEPAIIRVPMYSIPRDSYDDDESERVEDGRALQYEEVAEQGDGHGTHFVGIKVGNPIQERTVTVNTNSDFTAFPCIGCTECGRSQPFDQYKSSTFKELSCDSNKCSTRSTCIRNRCEIEDNSQDLSSFRATEATDWAYIGGESEFDEKDPLAAKKHGFKMSFGCQSVTRGWFRTHATDGLLGMGSADTSFLAQMYQAGKLANWMFALCFSHKLAESGDGSSSGALTLGGFDPRFHDSPVVWAENTEGPGYTMFLKKIYLREGGGQSVRPDEEGMRVVPVDFDTNEANHGGKGIHLDSGTPMTSLPETIEAPFRKVWRKITGNEFSYGRVRLLDGDLLRLPTLLFQFRAASDQETNGIDPYTVAGMAGDLDPTAPYDLLVAVPATHYMEYNPSNGYYRPRITFENQKSYIGSNLMQGHDVSFDVGKGRIGVAEVAVCIPRPTNGATADDDLFNTPGDVKDDDAYWKGQLGSSVDRNRNDDDGLLGEGLGGNNRGRPLGPGTMGDVYSFGTCDSLSCKIWVFTGYIAAIMLAYVIWKCATIKRPDEDEFGEDPFADDIEIEELESHGEYHDDPMYDDQDFHGDYDAPMEPNTTAGQSRRVVI